jgi:O-antigen/teichoic acid export membrane protein
MQLVKLETNLLKSFSIYTLAGFINKGFSFILLPFFTYYLTKEDYGILTIFSNSIYLITPFMNLGIMETLTVEYKKYSKEQLQQFIQTSFVIPVIFTFFSFLAIAIARDNIFTYTSLPLKLTILVVLLAFLNFFTEYLLAIFRNQNEPVWYVTVTICRTIVELVLSVVFIKYFLMGFKGRIDSLIISYSLVGIITLIIFNKLELLPKNLTINKNILNLILKRGAPTVPLALMIYVLNNADKYFINYFYGQEIVGLYGFANLFGMLLHLVTISFTVPFYPYMYDKLKTNNLILVKKMIYYFIGFLILAGILIYFISPFIIKTFISQNFVESIIFIPYLLLGQFFGGIFAILLGFLYFYKKNIFLYYISFSTVILSLFLYYFANQLFGIKGILYCHSITFLLPILFILPVIYKSINSKI